MGRTVADAVALLAAMVGPDEADPATTAVDWELAAHLRPDGLEGKRIGVVRSSAGFHGEVDALLEEAIEALRSGGATIVDDLELVPPEGISSAAYDLLLYEFKHGLNVYLASLPSDLPLGARTLEELIAFNEEHAEQEMPFFGQEIFVKSQAKGGLDETGYVEALRLVQSACREKGIDRLVAGHELDALIAPTGSPAWKIDLINGDHFIGGSSSYPARAGYPNITVPMGAVHGMPVGLSIFGPAWSEPTLIEIAYAFERRTSHRTPPDL
jgi:amidase